MPVSPQQVNSFFFAVSSFCGGEYLESLHDHLSTLSYREMSTYERYQWHHRWLDVKFCGELSEAMLSSMRLSVNEEVHGYFKFVAHLYHEGHFEKAGEVLEWMMKMIYDENLTNIRPHVGQPLFSSNVSIEQKVLLCLFAAKTSYYLGLSYVARLADDDKFKPKARQAFALCIQLLSLQEIPSEYKLLAKTLQATAAFEFFYMSVNDRIAHTPAQNGGAHLVPMNDILEELRGHLGLAPDISLSDWCFGAIEKEDYYKISQISGAIHPYDKFSVYRAVAFGRSDVLSQWIKHLERLSDFKDRWLLAEACQLRNTPTYRQRAVVLFHELGLELSMQGRDGQAIQFFNIIKSLDERANAFLNNEVQRDVHLDDEQMRFAALESQLKYSKWVFAGAEIQGLKIGLSQGLRLKHESSDAQEILKLAYLLNFITKDQEQFFRVCHAKIDEQKNRSSLMRAGLFFLRSLAYFLLKNHQKALTEIALAITDATQLGNLELLLYLNLMKGLFEQDILSAKKAFFAVLESPLLTKDVDVLKGAFSSLREFQLRPVKPRSLNEIERTPILSLPEQIDVLFKQAQFYFDQAVHAQKKFEEITKVDDVFFERRVTLLEGAKFYCEQILKLEGQHPAALKLKQIIGWRCAAVQKAIENRQEPSFAKTVEESIEEAQEQACPENLRCAIM